MSEAAADGADQLVGAWVGWWQDIIDASHERVGDGGAWWCDPAYSGAREMLGGVLDGAAWKEVASMYGEDM